MTDALVGQISKYFTRANTQGIKFVKARNIG